MPNDDMKKWMMLAESSVNGVAETAEQDRFKKFYELNKGRTGQPIINIEGNVAQNTILVTATPSSYAYFAFGVGAATSGAAKLVVVDDIDGRSVSYLPVQDLKKAVEKL